MRTDFARRLLRGATFAALAVGPSSCTLNLASSDGTPQNVPVITNNDYTVTGTVLGSDGTPAPNIQVIVSEGTLESAMTQTSGWRSSTKTDSKGRYELTFQQGYRSEWFVRARTADSHEVAMMFEPTRRKTELPSIRIWRPSVQQTTTGPVVHVSWSALSDPEAHYAIRRPSQYSSYRLEAAHERRFDVVPARDLLGTFGLIADSVGHGPDGDYSIRYESPAVVSAAAATVSVTRCTAYNTQGGSQTFAPCGSSGRKGPATFFTMDLGSPTSLAAVVVSGCSFFCTLYVSDDYVHWKQVFSSDNNTGGGTLQSHAIVPDHTETHRYFALSARLGSSYYDDTAAELAKYDESMQLTDVKVFSGQPTALASSSTAEDYREPTFIAYKVPGAPEVSTPTSSSSQAHEDDDSHRGLALPKDLLPLVVLGALAASILRFLGSGPKGGKR